MASEGSVTGWLGRLQAADHAAAQELWERYFPRLVGLARQKLKGQAHLPADEEDVALSAFDSFCRSAAGGRFPQLLDRDGLWRLLAAITMRKAANLLRDQHRQKRGGTGPPSEPEGERTLDQLLSREPTPDFAAQVAEQFQRLLRLLGDRELEAVAVLKMEGYSNEEIGGRLGFAVRSIKRKLQIIRRRWEKEMAS